MEINYDSLPEHMRGSIKRYIDNGVPPGDFLQAVLSNDLKESFSRADDKNIAAMFDWVCFLYNYAPIHCHGSKEKMEMWIESGGLHGLEDNNG